MDGNSKPETLDVWIVTDGTRNWFTAFEKRPAQLFADKFNSQMSDNADHVRVERLDARLYAEIEP